MDDNANAMERLRNMLNVPPANRPPDWINPLEKIEQLLTCSICLDRYKNPKLLPCQHTFCLEPCLEGLVDRVRRTVKCAECRAEHMLPYEDIKGFQTNYSLIGFLEIHLQATDENAGELEAYIKRYNLERCKICEEKAEVELCHHCQQKLCPNCRTSHLDLLKRDLGRLMNQVKRFANRINDSVEILARNGDNLNLNCTLVKDEVRDYVRRFTKELKKREDDLITEIDAFNLAESRLASNARENLELESVNINESCEKVESCLKGESEYTDEELMKFKQVFQDGLEHLRTVNVDADDICNKKIRFFVGPDPHLLPHAIAQFGELQVCSPQLSTKLYSVDQVFVPRFSKISAVVEPPGASGRYTTTAKKRQWGDPSLGVPDSGISNNNSHSSNNWMSGLQQQQQQLRDDSVVSASRKSSAPVNVVAMETGDGGYSSRFRRRHMLEEQAWNRLKADNAGTPGNGPSATNRISPGRYSDVETSSSSRPGRYSDVETSRPAGSPNRYSDAEPSRPPGSPGRYPSDAESSRPVGSPGRYSDAETSGQMRQVLVGSPPKIIETPSSSSGRTRTTSFHDPSLADAADDHHQQHHRHRQQLAEAAIKRVTTKSHDQQRRATMAIDVSAIQHAATSSAVQASGASPAPKRRIQRQETEDEELNQRIDSIRKEWEEKQRLDKEKLQSIAKKLSDNSLRSKTCELPIVVASEQNDENHSTVNPTAATAVANPTAAHEHLVPVPITVYHRPAHHHNHERPRSVELELPSSHTVGDWKKYLIPEDGHASLSSSDAKATATVVDYQTPAATGTRFVRSRTNPDFVLDSDALSDLNNYSSNDSSPNAMTNNKAPSRPERHNRFKRKAERSHPAQATATPPKFTIGDTYASDSDSRFDFSVQPRSIERGPGARFCRTFTEPDADYAGKGIPVAKFGVKGSEEGRFNWPRGVALTPGTGDIVICDSSNHRVQIFDAKGEHVKIVGGYGSGAAEFDCLAGVCVSKFGQMIVTDRYNHRVQVFDANGRFVREFGTNGQSNGRFNNPWGVATDGQGCIYVCDKDNHRIQIFQADGTFVGKFGVNGSKDGQFQNPHFIAINKMNQLYVTDGSNHRVQVFDQGGNFLFAFGSEGFHEGEFKYPRGIAVDDQGYIVVADGGNNRVQTFYPDGRFLSTFGSWGSADGQLKGVEGVAIDDRGRVIVTDRENHRVQIF